MYCCVFFFQKNKTSTLSYNAFVEHWNDWKYDSKIWYFNDMKQNSHIGLDYRKSWTIFSGLRLWPKSTQNGETHSMKSKHKDLVNLKMCYGVQEGDLLLNPNQVQHWWAVSPWVCKSLFLVHRYFTLEKNMSPTVVQDWSEMICTKWYLSTWNILRSQPNLFPFCPFSEVLLGRNITIVLCASKRMRWIYSWQKQTTVIWMIHILLISKALACLLYT